MNLQLALFIIAGCFISVVSNAQHENDRWIFGGSPFPTNPPALNFFSGTPVATPTAPIPNYWSTEAAAAVADKTNGNLLFYTDAIKVFNANNTPMPNGGASFTTNLNGCNSSTQGALILPRPGVPNHYYVFTVDCSEDFSSPSYSGLRYSEVDMTLNGGTGDVIAATRNTLLWGPPANNKLTEKLTATRHINGNDYWLVVHEWNTNNFLSFAVTCTGISTTPVISSVGTVHTSGSSFPEEVIGAMKISPDRSRLALVARGTMNLLEIFNFNAITGVVSNPITLPGNVEDYGVEFSPNSLRLYVSVYVSIPCCSGKIFQYNLAAGSTAAAIQGSKVQVVNSTAVGLGGMQLGPDGKIHISRALQINNLGIINSPNNVGASCGFSHTGAPLSARRSNIGLINLVMFQPTPVCLPLPVELLYFNASASAGKVNINWATASELNNDFFTIEKSNDAASYVHLATIDGAGTTSSTKEYFSEDDMPNRLTYYRLSQTDLDGKIKHYPSVAFNPKTHDEPAINFINSNNGLYITIPGKYSDEKLELMVLNTYGGIVYKETTIAFADNMAMVHLPAALEKGIYLIRARLGNDFFTAKFSR